MIGRDKFVATFSIDMSTHVLIATVKKLDPGRSRRWQLLDVENGTLLEKGLLVAIDDGPLPGSMLGKLATLDRDAGVFTLGPLGIDGI